MLELRQKLAIYMQDNLDSDYGKMGYGVMRYTDNPVVCVIDSTHAGKQVCQACDLPYRYPIVASVEQAAELGAEVLVLGTAPSGGRLPEAWLPPLTSAVKLGLCIVNGLHDPLHPRLGPLLAEQPERPSGQWIWDIRQPAFTPVIAAARAAELDNKRILLVGTDMAIGKMTAGLELCRQLKQRGGNAVFLATGQTGIAITGRGIPLDAFKLDYACGAVETLLLEAAQYDYVFIEGQGSLLHPGSSATLPLLRGSCATHLVMCHRAGMTHLRNPQQVKIPPLKAVIELNESLASACGALPPAQTIGVALNTAALAPAAARSAIARLEDELGLPVADTVRFGADKLVQALLDSA